MRFYCAIKAVQPIYGIIMLRVLFLNKNPIMIVNERFQFGIGAMFVSSFKWLSFLEVAVAAQTAVCEKVHSGKYYQLVLSPDSNNNITAFRD